MAVDSFDQPEALFALGVLVQHVWFREHISWFETIDDWPRYPAFPPDRDAELEELSGQVIAG